MGLKHRRPKIKADSEEDYMDDTKSLGGVSMNEAAAKVI